MQRRTMYGIASVVAVTLGAAMLSTALAFVSANLIGEWYVLPLVFIGMLLIYVGNELIS